MLLLNYKKFFIRTIVGLIVVISIYICIHTYFNNKIINTYAKGFEKNVFGDYIKNESDMVLAVYKAPLFQTYTNLSIQNNKDNIALIIWTPLYNDNFSYGIIITDHENEVIYQIETNEHLETEDKKLQQILDSKQEALNKIKTIANKEWGFNF